MPTATALGLCVAMGRFREEMTLCLATKMVLRRGDEGPVVTNLSTTQAIDDVAESYGREVVRTPIGQAYVAEAANNHAAAVAGEGSGGVVFPRINYGHDSLAAMGHILQLMAETGKSLRQLVNEMPEYSMEKATVPCAVERAFSVLEALRERGKPTGVEYEDLQDGVKYGTQSRWVHIRVSMTEPIIRIIGEARDAETAKELVRHYANEVRQYI